MKKSRYTEEQIAFALKQAETGTPVAEVTCRVVFLSRRCRWKKCRAGVAHAQASQGGTKRSNFWRSVQIGRRCGTCCIGRIRRR